MCNACKLSKKKTHNKTLKCKNDLKEYQNLIAGCFKRPLGTSLAIFNSRSDIHCMYRGLRLFQFSKRWDDTCNTEVMHMYTDSSIGRLKGEKTYLELKVWTFTSLSPSIWLVEGWNLKNKSYNWFVNFFHLFCFQNHST